MNGLNHEQIARETYDITHNLNIKAKYSTS